MQLGLRIFIINTHVFYCAVVVHLLSFPVCFLKNTIKYVHQFRFPPYCLCESFVDMKWEHQKDEDRELLE